MQRLLCKDLSDIYRDVAFSLKPVIESGNG